MIETQTTWSAAQPGVAVDELPAVAQTSQLSATIVVYVRAERAKT